MSSSQKRPGNLIIAVDEPIALSMQIGMGIQHCFAMSSTLVLAALVALAATDSVDAAASMVQITMIAAGIGTILQSINRGPVGSGLLCPSLAGPAFFPASILAAKTGGLSLVFGMTLVTGVFQAALSRIIHRLRALLPPEVTGVIVTMVGLSLVGPGVENLTGLGLGDKVRDSGEVIVGLSTLSLIFGITVWGKGVMHLYSVLMGILFGYVLSYAFGVIPPEHIERFLDVELLSWPSFALPMSLEFDWVLLAPFLIAGLASSIKAVGDISTAQRINDDDWVAPDMTSIKGGVLADALSVMTAGLLGGMGQSTSSSNVGISLATGVTSRKVGYSAGGIFVACAFVPALSQIFVLMPTPVKGAVLIFAACFMIVAGLQLVMTRLMDPRKTFVVGASIIAGLSVDILPGFYQSLPSALSSLATSSTSLATATAILLNLVFRIGVSRKAEIILKPADDWHDEVVHFMTQKGGEWGARRDVANRATTVLLEVVETIHHRDSRDVEIVIKAHFDQFRLDFDIRYPGATLVLPTDSPDHEDAMTNPDHWQLVSGAIIRSLSDEISQQRIENENLLHLQFDH